MDARIYDSFANQDYIFIDDTEKVSYAEDLLEDPEVLFYKFKYTTREGEIYRFTLYCNLRGYNHTEERLREIKETILKPGAKWFCNHCVKNIECYLMKTRIST